MKANNWFIVFFGLIPLIISCTGWGESIHHDQVSKWLRDEGDILTKEKTVGVLEYACEFVPSQFLALQELNAFQGDITQPALDSLNHLYRCALNFKLSLTGSGNLLYYNINDISGYRELVNYLNFHIQDFITFTLEGKNYTPVLSHFEGYNELSRKLVFHIAFEPDNYNCGKFENSQNEMKLTFQDPHWETGTQHFTFNIAQLRQVPDIVIAKK